MRTWVKWFGLVAATGVFASSAMAADHRDGSAETDGVKAEAPADINDVYAFMDGDDLAIIASIGGLPSEDFSDAVQYVFHIGQSEVALTAATAAPATETLVVCEFASLTDLSCYVGTPGEAATAVVSGDATANTGISSGGLKVHAGKHKDPFFFYLPGLQNALAHVDGIIDGNVANLVPLVDESFCPDLTGADPLEGTGAVPNNASIAATMVGMLKGQWDAAGVAATPTNTFATNNVSALVINISPDLLTGTGEYYQVYVTTHKKP